MKRNPEPLVLTWLVICLVVVLGGAVGRSAPVEKAWVLPVPGGWPQAGYMLAPLVVSLAIVALGALVLGIRRDRPLTKTWGELLLFYPLLFGFFWFVFPVADPAARDWLGTGVLLALALWLTLTRPGTGTRERPPYRSHFPADLLLLGGPILAGVLMDTALDLRAVLFSLFLYPFYSALQLAVFLVIPASRLKALDVPDRSIAAACAALFALAHWPNPLVMAATFLAMFLWARQRLRGRPLRELVLVMAVAATLFSQFLPDEVTRHLRVGPGYLRREAVQELATLGGSDLCDPRAFMTSAYPLTIGRPIYLQELDDWLTLIHRARRHTMAWQFFVSREYTDLAVREGLDPPPLTDRHWTALPSYWRDRITWYGQDTYWEIHGGNSEEFLAALYREILGRQPLPQEGVNWTFQLTPGQRMRLAEVLLEHRRLWRRQPAPTLSLQELRLP